MSTTLTIILYIACIPVAFILALLIDHALTPYYDMIREQEAKNKEDKND